MQDLTKQQKWDRYMRTFLNLYSCDNKYDFYRMIDTDVIYGRRLQPVYTVKDEEFAAFKERILGELQELMDKLEAEIAEEEGPEISNV